MQSLSVQQTPLLSVQLERQAQWGTCKKEVAFCSTHSIPGNGMALGAHPYIASVVSSTTESVTMALSVRVQSEATHSV
jgi:hypothetical protein